MGFKKFVLAGLVLGLLLSATDKVFAFQKSRCARFLERASYYSIKMNVNLWEADTPFFVKMGSRKDSTARPYTPQEITRQINQLIFYVRKQHPRLAPDRKALITQIKFFKKRRQGHFSDDFKPFDPEQASTEIQKPIEQITFRDMLELFRSRLKETQSQFSRGQYRRRPPVVAWVIGGVSMAITMGAVSFGYRWSNTVSGNLAAAPAELHGSDARRVSFEKWFGDVEFLSDLDKAAFDLYDADSRQYPEVLNSVKGLWEQYGFDSIFLVSDYIGNAIQSLQLNKLTDNFDSVRVSECKRLYQIYFAFPEYFMSETAGELSQGHKIAEVLDAYDPDRESLRELFQLWEEERDFQWTEQDIMDVHERLGSYN